VISWYGAVLVINQSPSAFYIFWVSYIAEMVPNKENLSARVSLSTLWSDTNNVGLLVVTVRKISVYKIDTV